MAVRILHVVTYMGRGGLETMLMNYYRNIDRDKIQFDFLTHRCFEADYDKEIEALGGKIYHLPNLNPFSHKYLKALDHFFKEHPEYKIIHSHLDCMAGIPLKYAKKNGVPVRIAHAHNSNQTKDKKYFLKLLFKRNIPEYATNLFACSENAGKWMFNGNKFSVLNNAIDAKRYAYNEKARINIRTEFGILDDTFVIGHVGRFFEQKNHRFLVEIFAQIHQRNPSSVLMLVGDGELRDQVEEQIQRKGLSESVIFTGVQADVSRFYQAMDVFVFPSLYEGLGIVAVEAQSSGLPCVISDGVPNECIVTTNLVTQKKLSDSAEEWASHILERCSLPREDHSLEVTASGYDIGETSRWLEEFYLTIG